jgi:hypothetical protein
MNKLMIMTAAVMMTFFTANAQNNDKVQNLNTPDRAEMVKNRTARTVERFGLNESQAKQLLELNTKYADRMPRMNGRRSGMRSGDRQRANMRNMQRKRERPSREQMESRMKEMRQVREAYDKELKKIMTEEQYTKYTEVQKQRMQRRGNGNRRQGGFRSRMGAGGQEID